MSTKRENFLTRISNSRRHSLLPEASSEHPGSLQGDIFQAAPPTVRLIEDFTRELRTLSGYVYLAGDQAEVAPTILEILQKHNANRIIAWDEEYLGITGLTAALAEAEIVLEDSHLSLDGAERQARLTQLDGVLAGLTGAQGGLADTGALALVSGPGRGRLVSMLPPVHIALLPANRLYPSLPAFLAANPTAATDGSDLVLIAGPSRTGDIEMTLSMGVHGPRHVHTIIIP